MKAKEAVVFSKVFWSRDTHVGGANSARSSLPLPGSSNWETAKAEKKQNVSKGHTSRASTWAPLGFAALDFPITTWSEKARICVRLPQVLGAKPTLETSERSPQSRNKRAGKGKRAAYGGVFCNEPRPRPPARWPQAPSQSLRTQNTLTLTLRVFCPKFAGQKHHRSGKVELLHGSEPILTVT